MDIGSPVKPSTMKVGRSVAERIRARILSGDLAPGQRLVEPDLIAELGVGRSALREAFVQLDAEGLIEIRHQRGATVTRLGREEMADLFAIRERLEGFAAFLAAQRVDEPGHREWLLAQRQNWMRAEMLESEREHMEENVPFHDGIIRMSGNGRLAEILQRLHVPAYRQRFMKLLERERREESVADHLAVIDALLRGDADAAEEAMRLHVRRSGELAQRIEGLG